MSERVARSVNRPASNFNEQNIKREPLCSASTDPLMVTITVNAPLSLTFQTKVFLPVTKTAFNIFSFLNGSIEPPVERVQQWHLGDCAIWLARRDHP